MIRKAGFCHGSNRVGVERKKKVKVHDAGSAVKGLMRCWLLPSEEPDRVCGGCGCEQHATSVCEPASRATDRAYHQQAEHGEGMGMRGGGEMCGDADLLKFWLWSSRGTIQTQYVLPSELLFSQEPA